MLGKKTTYGLAMLSGILLLLSFPPFNFGSFLAWFALVPLLIAVYYVKELKSIDRLAQVAGLFLLPVTWVVARGGMSLLPAFLSWLVPVLAFIMPAVYLEDTKHLRPRITLAYLPLSLRLVIMPLVWSTTEFLMMSLPILMKAGGAFGFFSIAKTQWRNVPILQLASFTGMYGVTFLILLVNCAIALAIVHWRGSRKVHKPAIVVLLLLLITFVYGLISVPAQAPGDVTAAIIQADIRGQEDIGDLYVTLSEGSMRYEPRVIMWAVWVNSSGSFLDPHHHYVEPFFMGPYVDEHREFCREHDVYLIGTSRYAMEQGMFLPVIVYPDGHVAMHHITYLIANLFDGLTPPFDLQTALYPSVESFEIEFGRIGLLNCQETAYPIPARRTVAAGAQLIAGESGDPPWYLHAFPGLMGSNMVFRAVENGVGTASFYQGEGSIMIDPYGRIVDDVTTPEMAIGELFFSNRRTFYSKYGDVFGWTVVGLTLMLVIRNSYLERKSSFKFCRKCGAQIGKDAGTCDKCAASQRKRPV